jgi:molecular chaperone GrpE
VKKDNKEEVKDEIVTEEIKEQEVNDKKIEEIELLTDKIKELDEKILRNQAEFINYKRRKEDEIERYLKYANMDIVKDILPILDNFERATQMDDTNLTDEVSNFLSGFKMMYNNLKQVLTNYGVTEIVAINQQFDPNIHEAVLTGKDETKESGIILDVLQKGYLLKEKVIRPAMVKVND